MSKYISPEMLAVLVLASGSMLQAPQVAVAHHKQIVKRSHAKQQKPGRGKAAKGYDPETKTWRK